MIDNEPTTVAPPNTTDVLSSTVQTLNDRVEALRTTISRVHSKLFGDYLAAPSEDVDQVSAAPGRLPLLTRDLEEIIAIVQGALLVAESLDNQA